MVESVKHHLKNTHTSYKWSHGAPMNGLKKLFPYPRATWTYGARNKHKLNSSILLGPISLTEPQKQPPHKKLIWQASLQLKVYLITSKRRRRDDMIFPGMVIIFRWWFCFTQFAAAFSVSRLCLTVVSCTSNLLAYPFLYTHVITYTINEAWKWKHGFFQPASEPSDPTWTPPNGGCHKNHPWKGHG